MCYAITLACFLNNISTFFIRSKVKNKKKWKSYFTFFRWNFLLFSEEMWIVEKFFSYVSHFWRLKQIDFHPNNIQRAKNYYEKSQFSFRYSSVDINHWTVILIHTCVCFSFIQTELFFFYWKKGKKRRYFFLSICCCSNKKKRNTLNKYFRHSSVQICRATEQQQNKWQRVNWLFEARTNERIKRKPKSNFYFIPSIVGFSRVCVCARFFFSSLHLRFFIHVSCERIA